MPFFFKELLKEHLCQIETGGGEAETADVMQKNVQNEFAVLSIGETFDTFQCEGAECGESSQKSDK